MMPPPDRNVYMLSLGSGVRFFGISLIAPFFLVYLNSSYGLDYLLLGILYGAAAATAIPVGAIAGLLADRFGRKRVIILAFLAECVTAGVLALTSYIGSVPGMVISYLVVSPVFTLSGPATSAYVADVASGEARTRGYSLLRIAYNAGFAAGTALGGLLLSFLAFPDVILMTTLVLVAVTGAFLLRLDPSPYDRAPDPGAAPRRTQSVRASFRLLARDRVFLEVCIAFTLAWFLFGQYQVSLPLYANRTLGIPYAILGIGFSINGLMVVFGQMPITRAMLGRKHTTIGVYGLVAYAASFIGLGLAGRFQYVPIVSFLAATAVMIVGENLISIPMTTLPSNLAPPTDVGFYNGAFQTVTALGTVAAGILGGAVLGGVANPLLVWLFLAAPAVPAIVILASAARRISPDANRA